LSPAWSVMIIFLLVDRSSTRVFCARRVSVATWCTRRGGGANG
jgi:hypothetical protein